jgi:hypothetical protein
MLRETISDGELLERGLDDPTNGGAIGPSLGPVHEEQHAALALMARHHDPRLETWYEYRIEVVRPVGPMELPPWPGLGWTP